MIEYRESGIFANLIERNLIVSYWKGSHRYRLYCYKNFHSTIIEENPIVFWTLSKSNNATFFKYNDITFWCILQNIFWRVIALYLFASVFFFCNYFSLHSNNFCQTLSFFYQISRFYFKFTTKRSNHFLSLWFERNETFKLLKKADIHFVIFLRPALFPRLLGKRNCIFLSAHAIWNSCLVEIGKYDYMFFHEIMIVYERVCGTRSETPRSAVYRKFIGKYLACNAIVGHGSWYVN